MLFWSYYISYQKLQHGRNLSLLPKWGKRYNNKRKIEFVNWRSIFLLSCVWTLDEWMACIKGRSLTTSTKYYLLLSTYPWLNSFTVEGKICIPFTFTVCNTYLPHLLNAVCERPLRVRSTIQAATIHVSSCNAMHRNQFWNKVDTVAS